VEAQPDRQRRPRHGVAQSRVRAARVGRRRDGRAGSEGVVTERVERRQGTAALAPRVESFGAGDDDEKAACAAWRRRHFRTRGTARSAPTPGAERDGAHGTRCIVANVASASSLRALGASDYDSQAAPDAPASHESRPAHFGGPMSRRYRLPASPNHVRPPATRRAVGADPHRASSAEALSPAATGASPFTIISTRTHICSFSAHCRPHCVSCTPPLSSQPAPARFPRPTSGTTLRCEYADL